MANMIRGISDNGGVVFYGVDSTNIVAEAERIHKTSAVTSAALGRLLTAASMMGITLKSEKDSLTLRLNGGGPAGTVLAVADGAGDFINFGRLAGSKQFDCLINSEGV